MFRPTEVRLHNFCGYDDAVFSLAGGLTAVTGRNGSGKTTVLRGLMYALTGVVDGSWGTQSDLQKDGTIDPGYAEATLVGNNRELVIRRFYTSGVKFPDRITERQEDGTFKEVAIRRAQVDAYMQNIFGIPCRFMFQLCWCRQAQLDVMLTSPAATINTFLGVVFNMQNVEKLRDKLHEHESRITQLSSVCLSELPRLQEALKALPDIQELERLKDTAQASLKNAEIRYNAMMQLMLNGITKLEWEEKHRELSNAIQEEQKEISSFGDMTEPPTNGESVADLGNLTNANLSERTHWSVRVSTTNTALLSLKKELTAAENEHVRQTELFSDWTGKLDAVSDTCDFCGGHVTDKETYLRIKCKMITGYDSKEGMHRAVEQEQEQHREAIKRIETRLTNNVLRYPMSVGTVPSTSNR